jgi:hypothetical protein
VLHVLHGRHRATVIGNTLARKIRKIGRVSSTPNQRIATGIHAIGEIGRSAWMIGFSARNAGRNQPSTSPSGTPTSTASPNPIVTRNNDATTYLSSRPFRASSTMPPRPGRASGTGRCPRPRRRSATTRAGHQPCRPAAARCAHARRCDSPACGSRQPCPLRHFLSPCHAWGFTTESSGTNDASV